MANKYLLILAVVLCSVTAYTGDDLPRGPFCGRKYPNGDNHCCDDRHDECSHPILDTLCYCDQFCNRTLSHDDCCPDYGPVCKGIPETEYIVETPTCKLNGKLYFRSETAKIDCNQCVCQYVDERKDAVYWQCEKKECTNSEDVVRGVWNSGVSWRPHNYTQFRDKTLDDTLLYKLGTLPLDANTKRMGAISYTDQEHPVEFDARRHWPSFISPIQDQGWCGSDWAVALTSVASDRFAIQSNGAEGMVLSAQTLLSCNIRGQRGCQGGYIAGAWLFATNFGLVDELCFPYKAQITKCPFKMHSTLVQDGCRPLVAERDFRYRVGPAARLTHEQDIMFDIRTSGPVFAIMEVYQDFFHYRDGIYRHTRYGNQRKNGLHSVRIVGWGEKQGDKYWIVANSWGQEWGENGYFKIARGSNEVGIESFVVSASAEVQATGSKK